MTKSLRVEPEFSIEALEKLTEQWDRLDANTFPRTPFTSPTWNLLWWKHYHRSTLVVRDRVRAFSVWSANGRLCAIAPMMVTDIPCLGLLSPRKLQLFGADANVTEIPRVVCAPDDEFAVVSALVQHLKSHSTDWDFVSWRGLSDTEPVRNLVGAENMIPSASTPDYYLTPTEDFKSSLPRNVKESLRKCYNSLKRDNHEFEFRVVKDVETVDEALETFFRLHASRAAREDTIAHRDNFAIGRARAFLSSYIRAAAAEGHVQVFQLVINRQVVATRIGFVFGTHLYLYFSGYLPEWGKYSVMTTTVWETIQYAIRSGYKVVNLSPGTDVSKTRWRPQEANFSSVTWIAPSIRGPVAHQGFTSLNNLAHKPLFARGLHQIRLDN